MQNNDKYCPETLTGTAFSNKKYAQIKTWQTAAQQATTAVSVSVCWLDYDLPQTACDYHKVGMSVKGDSWVPIEPIFIHISWG